MDYVSLNKHSNKTDLIYCILNKQTNHEKSSVYIVDVLIQNFGYTVKPLFAYLDYLATYEALTPYDVFREIYDYVKMMNVISPKFEKYPRHFLSAHAIASRNYNRLKQEFPEELFQNRIDTTLEGTYKEYTFKYPTCIQDIKDEAVQQNNCVASYIQSVINGDCHIMFLRKKILQMKVLLHLK